MKGNLPAIVILVLLFSPIVYQLFVVFRQVKLGKLSLKGFWRILRKVALFAILGGIVILTLNHTNYLNYQRPIPYQRIDSIGLDDFLGLEFFRKRHNGNPRYAYIVTTIENEIRDNEVYIESFFHPSRSYVYNSQIHSEELLSHELYHFKVTELYTRMIRKEISQLEAFKKNKIKSIIKKYEDLELNYQLQYDYDTYHSYVLKEQKKYEHEIDSLISSLAEFSNPKITTNAKE